MKQNQLLITVVTFLLTAVVSHAQNLQHAGEKGLVNYSAAYAGFPAANKLPAAASIQTAYKSYASVQAPGASKKDSSKRYGGWYVGTKALPLKTDKGTITLKYTDYSPTKDYFYGSKEVKKSSYAFNLDIGLQGGYSNAHHWEFLLGGSFGSLLVRFYAQAGYGWNFPLADGRITIRPVLNIAYGNVRYKMGDMDNTSTYIQVIDTKFYSKKVAVSAVTNPLAVIPRLDVPFKIGKKSSVKVFAGYHLTVKKNTPFLRFQGEDQNHESVTAKEKITSTHVNLMINGKRIQKMPVDLDGLVFGIGIGF